MRAMTGLHAEVLRPFALFRPRPHEHARKYRIKQTLLAVMAGGSAMGGHEHSHSTPQQST